MVKFCIGLTLTWKLLDLYRGERGSLRNNRDRVKSDTVVNNERKDRESETKRGEEESNKK